MKYIKIPIEPSEELINSMCLRFDHSFGLNKIENSLSCGFTENERDSLRATMRQLYEEIVEKGFYKY